MRLRRAPSAVREGDTRGPANPVPRCLLVCAAPQPLERLHRRHHALHCDVCTWVEDIETSSFSLGLTHSLYSFVYFDLFTRTSERFSMPTSPSQPIVRESVNVGVSLGQDQTLNGVTSDWISATKLEQPTDLQVLQTAHESRQDFLALITIQTARQERVEQAADAAWQEVAQLQAQVEHLQRRSRLIAEELAAAEGELQCISAIQASPRREGDMEQLHLLGRTVVYIGGRPSSTPAIRDFVQRHGGEFLHHSAGVSKLPNTLTTLRSGTCIVAFPMDCADHEYTMDLRHTCERLGLPFMALRTASLSCFAATFRREIAPRTTGLPATACLRHG